LEIKLIPTVDSIRIILFQFCYFVCGFVFSKKSAIKAKSDRKKFEICALATKEKLECLIYRVAYTTRKLMYIYNSCQHYGVNYHWWFLKMLKCCLFSTSYWFLMCY